MIVSFLLEKVNSVLYGTSTIEQRRYSTKHSNDSILLLRPSDYYSIKTFEFPVQ